MSIIGYYPEMGEKKPENAQGNVQLAHYGRHYFVETPLELSGRGIENLGVLRADELTPQGQYKAGWHRYLVTLLAMKKLAERYNFASQYLLD